MNNCNAGIESITLAPNGNLYLCPGFYYDDEESVGNLDDGINIKNQQLLRLDHAPLCRICDAYQCKRCIWLNKKTTIEVNTPSHEQCVMAHLERNQSRLLLTELQEHGLYDNKQEIKEISYVSLTLVMGVVFQLPVIAFFLGKMGIVTSDMLAHYRKHSFIVIMLVAAIITPPDLMTLILVTIPLYLLYGVSIHVIAWTEPRITGEGST